MILSGYADFSYAQQAMQNDCTDYILKPVDKEMLLKVLNKVLVLKTRKTRSTRITKDETGIPCRTPDISDTGQI